MKRKSDLPVFKLLQKSGACLLFGGGMLLLGGLLWLGLVQTEPDTGSRFRLDQARRVADADRTSQLILEGSGLQTDLNALLVPIALDPQARIARHLQGEYIRTLAVRGPLILTVVDRSRLLVWQKTEQDQARVIGSLELPGIARDLVLHGDQVVVGYSSPGGISLVDLQRPEQPALIRHWPGEGSVQDMLVFGDQLVFVDYHHGLFSLDLTDRNFQPRILSEMRSPWCLAGEGQRLAVGDNEGRVRCFELSPRGVLSLVMEEILPAPVRGLTMTADRLSAVTQTGRLAIWDLDDWPRPRRTGTLDLPGKVSCLETVPGSTDLLVGLVVAGFVRVGMGENGEPLQTGHLYWPINTTNIAIQDGLVYANGFDGLGVFALESIATGAGETTEARLAHTESLQLAAWGNRLVGHDGTRLRHLQDFPPAAAGEAAEVLALPRQAQVEIYTEFEARAGWPTRILHQEKHVGAALLEDHLLYVLSGEMLSIFDLGRPEAPQRLGGVALPGRGQAMVLHPGGYLYVAAERAGLLVVDIRDPVHPTLVDRQASPRHLHKYRAMRDLLLVGNHLYVAESAGGVALFDLAEPAAPRWSQSLLTPGYATSLARRDELLLVADGQSGIFLFDIEDPSAPRHVDNWNVPTKVDQMVAMGGQLFIGNVHSGVFQMPLPVPLQKLHPEGDHRARVILPKRAETLRHARVVLYDGRQTATAPVEIRPAPAVAQKE